VIERASPRHEVEPPPEEDERRDERPAPPDLGGARAQAERVRDEQLRAAIEAALRASSGVPPETPGEGLPQG